MKSVRPLGSIGIALSVLSLFSIGWDASAQNTAVPPGGRDGSAAQLAALAGTVMDVNGRPLEGVVVKAAGARAATVTTNASGRYVFDGLLAGSYALLLSKSGYAPIYADSGKARRLRLLPGQQLEGVDFRLEKEASLSGRVVGEDKNPLTGIRVSALARAYRGGRPFYQVRGTAKTDDLGEFHIVGLSPGRYNLEAMPPARTVITALRRSTATGRTDAAYVPIYYLSAESLEAAAPLNLSAGEHRNGLDIVLPRQTTFPIRASLKDVRTGQAPVRALLRLLEEAPTGWRTMASTTLAGAREFEIRGVPRGRYRLVANTFAEDEGGRALASMPVEVTNRGLPELKLLLFPGAEVDGAITIADPQPGSPLPSTIRVHLEPKDRDQYVEERLTTAVGTTGAFSFHTILPDEYWLFVSGLPKDYYVKQVVLQGQDVLHRPVFIGAGGGSLQILLGRDGAVVTGAATSKDGQPIFGAAVVLTPAEVPNTPAPQQIQVQFTDQTGQFDFAGVSPGDYRIIAFSSLPPGQAEDPTFLRAYVLRGLDLKLDSKTSKQVSVEIINLDDANPSTK